MSGRPLGLLSAWLAQSADDHITKDSHWMAIDGLVVGRPARLVARADVMSTPAGVALQAYELQEVDPVDQEPH